MLSVFGLASSPLGIAFALGRLIYLQHNNATPALHWQVDPAGEPDVLVLHVSLKWESDGPSKTMPVKTWEPWTNLLDETSPMCSAWLADNKAVVDSWLPDVEARHLAEKVSSARAFTDDDDDGPQMAGIDVISAMAAVIGWPDFLACCTSGP